VALVALIISLASAATTAVIGVWVAFRTRLKVTITLNVASMATGSEQVPLARILVNSQGKALTVEDISFEWVSPLPRPESWGWGAPSVQELGLPPEVADMPLMADFLAPIPPAAPYYLQDGETKPFTACIRTHSQWGDGTECAGQVRGRKDEQPPKALREQSRPLRVPSGTSPEATAQGC
jgi:hypothetical protein